MSTVVTLLDDFAKMVGNKFTFVHLRGIVIIGFNIAKEIEK